MKTEVPRSSNFSQYKAHNSSLSSLFYSHTNTVPIDQSDHSLLHLLDKLDKQDATTRLKSARSLTQLLKEKELSDYRVEKFVFVFGKLALVDPDPLVRIALSEALEQYFICSKKSFQSFFKSNYYLIKSCSYDDTQKVADSYTRAIAALGGPRVLNNIYNYVKDDLPMHIKIVLGKPYVEYIKKWKKAFAISHDQLEKCYSRLITAILNFIILDVQLDDYSAIWTQIKDLIWDFLGFSSFETTKPYNIRTLASMLIDKAIEADVDILPSDIKLLSKSLRVFYDSESEYVAEKSIKLFKSLIKINQIDIVKDIIVNSKARSDGRFGNRNFCMGISEIIISCGDYFRELIPKFITLIEHTDSIKQLLVHYNSDDEIMSLILEKISSILRLECVSPLALLDSLTDLVCNFDLQKMESPYIPCHSEYPKVIPFIPSIMKLKLKFGLDCDDLIRFILIEMIPQLVSGRGRFSATQVPRLDSAVNVFEICKEYGKNFNFDHINMVEFYPLSLNTNTLTGLEDRIAMDIKLAKKYFFYLNQKNIEIDIKTIESSIFDKVSEFWTCCLKYFIGLLNQSLVFEMIPTLLPEANPFVKVLTSHENFANSDKINELFYTCYENGRYELASMLSRDPETHLLCLKAGHPPSSYPLKSYISYDILESLIQQVMTTSRYNESIDIIANKLPEMYIESLYKVLFTNIGMFSLKELIQITNFKKICPNSLSNDLIDKARNVITLINLMDFKVQVSEFDVTLAREILLRLNLDDLFTLYEMFEALLRYPGMPSIPEYICAKVSNTHFELFDRALKEDLICDQLADIEVPKCLKWLIPMEILNKVDNISNSPFRFRYCLGAYTSALNEVDANSTYFMLKFCKKFITSFEAPNKRNDSIRLKMSFSEYITELSQIVSLANPDEFDYDGRCFILSLFYSIQSLESVKFIEEFKQYLNLISNSLEPMYLDILIGSKSQEVTSLGIEMFGKIFKNDNNFLLKPQNFDTELDLISQSDESPNFIKRSLEYQYELESRYPNFLKILLGYVESPPQIYVSVWKLLMEFDTSSYFPNYDQLDVFINEIITMYINGTCDVSKMNVLIFKRFPQYILDRAENQNIRYFISDISDLIQKEVELMNKWKIAASFKGVAISGTFKVEMQNINFKMHFTEEYPFEEAIFTIDKNEMKGISKKQILSWLDSSKHLLRLGKIALAVKNIKENITQFYKGVSECNICLAAFHTESKTFANKRCQVCKNTFHSFCLLRWFRTSHKPKCPICQSHTAIAFPRRINTDKT